jgi:hypothetical protein
MTDMNLGVSSAKRATWRETDTRPLLQDIVAKNPKLDDKKLFQLFWNEIEEDKDHLRAIAQYWFDLAMIALRRRPHDNRVKRTKRYEEAKTKIKQRIQQEVTSALLQLMMPNGKVLGDCTGKECATFGGWFSALAEEVPAKSTVAETLSEKQVYKLWQANK